MCVSVLIYYYHCHNSHWSILHIVHHAMWILIHELIYKYVKHVTINYGPEGRPYSDQRVRPFVRPFVTDYFCWRVVVCVRFASETTWPISPMMIPINWGNSVEVQRALHFDLDPSMIAGQGHEILWFWEFRCLTGSSLCSLLLRNYSTDFSNDDTNQLRQQCRYATCTSCWPWPLHDCRSRSRNTLILGI